MKKLLMISPNYFEYNKIICENLMDMNYEVYRFDDRPTANIFLKSILRIIPKLFARKNDKYYFNIIEKTRFIKFDYVFVILGQTLTVKIIESLKTLHPESKFIYYLWDSIANFPQCLSISDVFDSVYTFDKRDSAKYDFKFLPLFYSYDFDGDKKKYDYDLSYIGTIKKGKLRTYINVKKYCEENEIKFFGHPYLQSRLVYFYYRLFDKDFKTIRPKIREFSFTKLSYESYLQILKKSRATLDIQMEDQDGLPMRIFECIGTKTKVVSFNSAIKDYDFYDPNNFLLLDFMNGEFIIPKEFFKTKYFEIPINIRNRYSIHSRLKAMGF